MYGNVWRNLSNSRRSLEDQGRKYWKKRSYIFQGFVVEDGLKETEKSDNPIRRFIIGPQIFQLIRGALLDPEMDDLPTDAVNGVDFKLIKTSKGGYADYSTSKWSRRSRPLDDKEAAALEANGLFSLKDYLPKKPTDVEVKVIKEMFEASVDGEPFDMDRWGQYFKPAGMSQVTGDPVAKNATASKPQTSADLDEDPPFDPDPVPATKSEAAPASSGSSKAEDILAMIRNRQK